MRWPPNATCNCSTNSGTTKGCQSKFEAQKNCNQSTFSSILLETYAKEKGKAALRMHRAPPCLSLGAL